MFLYIIMTLTIISIFIIIYHHVGYPLILKWVKASSTTENTAAQHRGYNSSDNDNELPSISIVIPAYNEKQWIADKINNLATLDYPQNKMHIIIACDGCTDDTAAIANAAAATPECESLNINVINFTENRGKVAVLNEVLAGISTDLVALSDVSALISIDALLIAAERFKDEKVGVLNGHYQLLSPGSAGEQAYWNYQSQIKRSEAALGGTLGSHGAFYIFRTHLFEPLAADTINDDFILPMKIVAAGYHSSYDDSINALELEQAESGQDHQRRKRIAAGNFQQLIRLKALLTPKYGKTAFSFFSGKGLRVLMPFFMIFTLIGSLILAPHYTSFLILSVLQVLVYLVAYLELYFTPKSSPKIIKLLAYIVGGHTAGLIGALRYIVGLDKGRWFKFDH